MNMGLYPRLAADGIRKNKKLYIPYILTSIGMIAMFYIVIFLQYDDLIHSIYGDQIVATVLNLGGWVIAIFSCAFMFYTNSFLMRRRKKEFGLYNILGMNKLNIGRIILWETLAVAALSLSVGFLLGITFSKLAEMVFVRILRAEVSFSMAVPPQALLLTLAVFGAIFLLLLLNSLRQVFFSKTVSLMKSENAGEKAPRANWVLGILGVATLGAAYYIAINVVDPVEALATFFVAVIMVIAATYLIMIAGSVVMCRILQKKKGYYYKARHFISVSSMAYRMKRNGAGLASICILATMVLVMISSTASLYFGAENTIMLRYPKEINVNFSAPDGSFISDGDRDAARKMITAAVHDRGASTENITDYCYVSFTAKCENGVLNTDFSSTMSYSDLCVVYVVSTDDYEALSGRIADIKDGEVLICAENSAHECDTVVLGGCSYLVKDKIESFVDNGDALVSIANDMYIVTNNVESAVGELLQADNGAGGKIARVHWVYAFDTMADESTQNEVNRSIRELFSDGGTASLETLTGFHSESRAAERNGFYNMYGSLFFLGIMLSVVFMFAAVLIIYYKQISEGYEDQSRFEIMQKVGLTKRDIKKSINSQLLTVFFMPLVGAALHLAFAFPMIRKMLLLFGLNNVWLFALTTVICVAAFCAVYVVVYKITSNAYFAIVSGAENK